MEWLPAIKPGIWNAWWLTLFALLHPLIMKWVDKAMGDGNLNQKMGEVTVEEEKKKTNTIPMLLLSVLVAYSIFLPLKLATAYFYAGMLIYIAGAVMFVSAIISAVKTPSGQVFSGGMYRYSRHPLYLSFLVIFAGISLTTVSWLFLVLSMGWMFFPLSQVTGEEQGCHECFGEAYREYMNKTPKTLGIAKSN